MRSKAKEYSKKTLKWGIGAIVAWLCFLLLTPLLLGLLSYLFTFINWNTDHQKCQLGSKATKLSHRNAKTFKTTEMQTWKCWTKRLGARSSKTKDHKSQNKSLESPKKTQTIFLIMPKITGMKNTVHQKKEVWRTNHRAWKENQVQLNINAIKGEESTTAHPLHILT